jgi:hypothetical protein
VAVKATYNLEGGRRFGLGRVSFRVLVPQSGKRRIQLCQLPQPLGGGMRLQFEDRLICRPEDRYAMAKGRMNPLDAVGWR